jgi:hypothetical protein
MLETLCELLEEETARQTRIHHACMAQREAVAAQDVDRVNEATARLTQLMSEAKTAEMRRAMAIAEVVTAYELPEDRQNMSGIIAVAPPAFQDRLRTLQATLKELLRATERIIRDQGAAVRRSLGAVDQGLRSLRVVGAGAYDARGERELAAASVSRLNTRG